ncbi:hypothetical protein HYI43_11205 [Staphylococcus taiwanensis]|nr:hypothetical protein HYI43_11205 [Staphylococcus taiwanensis]
MGGFPGAFQNLGKKKKKKNISVKNNKKQHKKNHNPFPNPTIFFSKKKLKEIFVGGTPTFFRGAKPFFPKILGKKLKKKTKKPEKLRFKRGKKIFFFL